MDALKELLQKIKWQLQNLKQQLPKLKWQLQNNKPLALLCIAVLGLLLFSGLKGLIKSPASADRKAITIEAHTKVLAAEPMYKTVTLFGQVNAAPDERDVLANFKIQDGDTYTKEQHIENVRRIYGITKKVADNGINVYGFEDKSDKAEAYAEKDLE